MTTQREQSFPAVLSALFGADEVPVHLVYRLSDMGAANFELFQREWLEVSEERRAALVRHMADIAEENYLVDFTPLFAHLFNDTYATVRQAALDGVWDSTDSGLVRPIIGLLQGDRDINVRAAAARALAHYVLLAEWGQIRPAVAAPAIDALLAEHDRPNTPLEVKRAALEAVAAANNPRIPDMILNAYDDGPEELQLSALFAMGLTADRRWLPLLNEEMQSPSADFRAEAARAAGGLGSADSIDALEGLLTDQDLEVAMAAVYALGQIGGDRAVELLTRLSEDPDYEELYDAIDEALEEADLLEGGFDLLALDEADLEGDDDGLLDDLRAN
ncbi:MAG: HEAT repeat domain-containing protein [Candidatus Promineofilum sp.]|jgi:HEAT repeat protein|nr:HEAT repeat domain-containing protein [Promineifilum sp.]